MAKKKTAKITKAIAKKTVTRKKAIPHKKEAPKKILPTDSNEITKIAKKVLLQKQCLICRKSYTFTKEDLHLRVYSTPSGLVTKYSVLCPKCGLRMKVQYSTVEKLEGV